MPDSRFNPEAASERLRQGHIPLIYWDSGIFINLVKRDVLPEVKELVDLAGWWQVRIITSSLTLVEFLRQDSATSRYKYTESYFNDLFNKTHLHLVSLYSDDDPAFFIRLARDIRVAHSLDSDRRPTRKTVGAFDALHLATAIGCNASVLHTLDRRAKPNEVGLSSLDGKVQVGEISLPLRISRPELVQGDAKRLLYHKIGCPWYSRDYKRLRDNKLIEPA